MPLLLGDSNRYTATNGYYYDDPLTNFYQNIFLDVVVESHVAGQTFFPTEKTIRPIYALTPFVVFGPQGYLSNLQARYGFKTFSNWWSEDYDNSQNYDRIKMMYQLI